MKKTLEEKEATLAIRTDESNMNHHLWNNNGTWFIHYTVHPTPLTKQRIRRSLKTKSLGDARVKRDQLFKDLLNEHIDEM